MRKLILLSGCLLAFGAIANPALAKSKSAATCDMKEYSYLVGKNVSETRFISDDFRVVAAGSPADAAQPKRLTIVYDKGSDRILSVSCG
jgi:hypothetical protein